MRYSNRKMHLLIQDLLDKKGHQTKKHAELTHLMSFIWPVFYEIDGCVLVDFNNERVEHIANTNDLTALEASENHIHIDSINTEFQNRPKDGLRFGYKLFEIWEAKLRSEFPQKKFSLILAYDGKYTTLRFHSKHENEADWIDLEDIEAFKEAIIVSEI